MHSESYGDMRGLSKRRMLRSVMSLAEVIYAVAGVK